MTYLLSDSRGPTIQAERKDQVADAGKSITLHCRVNGGDNYDSSNIRWFREHLPLPPNVRQLGEYIEILNLQPSDGGRYFCEVPSSGGTATDFIDLRINGKI